MVLRFLVLIHLPSTDPNQLIQDFRQKLRPLPDMPKS